MSSALEISSKYRECITNGLDLVSFLFLTPQLLRFIGWGIAKTIAALCAITAPLMMVAPPLIERFHVENVIGRLKFDLYGLPPFVFLYAVFMLALFAFAIYAGYDQEGRLMSVELEAKLVRHSFALGVLLFLLSRGFALTAAVFEAIN